MRSCLTGRTDKIYTPAIVHTCRIKIKKQKHKKEEDFLNIISDLKKNKNYEYICFLEEFEHKR